MGVCESTLPSIYNQKLSDEITLLAGQINATTYRFLKLVAEFDRREGWAGEGIRSCAHWLNWKCGIALGAAREKVRVARCLEALPKINEAFESGALSFSKVRAMTRIATNENEEFLLMIAKHGTASHMEQLVGKYKTVTRNHSRQENKTDDDRESESKLLSYQDDGNWCIHAKLPVETGSLVIKAINVIMQDEKKRQEQEQEQIETQNKHHQENDKDNSKNVSAETPSNEFPFARKRADALVIMAEHFLASKSNAQGIKTLAGNERTQIMLHVDLKTLQSRGY